MNRIVAALLTAALGGATLAAAAQELDARFACSAQREEDGEQLIYSDIGSARLNGARIEAFSWESALYRSTHGFDCSIDDSDGLTAEVRDEPPRVTWRLALKDARLARRRRGFDFDRGTNCTIRLVREGDMLQVMPTCPALCGSRPNFTQLSVDLKTGACRYEE
jgi:hypothetical protein